MPEDGDGDGDGGNGYGDMFQGFASLNAATATTTTAVNTLQFNVPLPTEGNKGGDGSTVEGAEESNGDFEED